MVAQASLVALLAVASVASVAYADEPRYALGDLEALVAGKAYREAYDHLRDIAPSQRTAKWLDIAAAASAGVLEGIPPEDGIVLIAMGEVEHTHPRLLEHAGYLKARTKLGLAGLTACYRSNLRNCAVYGVRLVEGDRKIALDVAGVTVQHGHAGDAVPHFALDAKRACKHEGLSRAVVSALDRPNATEAVSLMTTCWDPVKDAVVKAFDDAGKNSALHKNTCPALAAKRLLSPLQAKRCRT